MKTQSLWLASLALVGLCGCSTPAHLPEYSGAAAAFSSGNGHASTAESDGVFLTLEPFADKARCETHFALNAPAAATSSGCTRTNDLETLRP